MMNDENRAELSSSTNASADQPIIFKSRITLTKSEQMKCYWERKKMALNYAPKTAAERMRTFRERHKKEPEQTLSLNDLISLTDDSNSNTRILNDGPKTPAERARKYRERHKKETEPLPIKEPISQTDDSNTNTQGSKRRPKTPAERAKTYRERKKIAQKNSEKEWGEENGWRVVGHTVE